MKAVISKSLLKKLTPRKRPYEVRDTQLKGFILRVQPSGSMSYIAQWQRGKRYTIGKADRLTPAAARHEAVEKLAKAALGDDPMAERKLAKSKDLKTYLDEVYEPWAVAHLKTGKGQVERIRSCFSDLLDSKLGDITPWLIEKYRSARLKKGVTARTVNRDVHALRAALRRAYDWEIIPKHPLAKIKNLKEDSRARVRYLSPDEELRLRAALDDREERLRSDRDNGNAWRQERGYKELPDLRGLPFANRLKPLVLLSLNTGIRRGEAFNLRWSDMDLELANLTAEGQGVKTTQTRHIPLNAEALANLRDWKSQSDLAGYVFPADDGSRLDNVNKSWKLVLKKAHITEFRWHDLRHTFASNLVMAGEDLNTVRELLGHSDMKMTLRYAHLAPEKKAAAVEKLVTRRADTMERPGQLNSRRERQNKKAGTNL